MTDHTSRPNPDDALDRARDHVLDRALDRALDHALDDAAQHWRVAPPPTEALWDDIAAEAFTTPVIPMVRPSRGASWRAVGMLAAACLVVGVAVGRFTRTAAPVVATAASSAATSVPAAADPSQRLTEDLLARTAMLLASLPANNGSAARDPRLADQAARMLATTRVLLDATATQDHRMRLLLEDLELVLVQVARLRTPREGSDLSIIRAAVAERDLVPRLRLAAADLSGGSE